MTDKIFDVVGDVDELDGIGYDFTGNVTADVSIDGHNIEITVEYRGPEYVAIMRADLSEVPDELREAASEVVSSVAKVVAEVAETAVEIQIV